MDDVYSSNTDEHEDLAVNWVQGEARLRLEDVFVAKGARFAAFKFGMLIQSGHSETRVLVKTNKGWCIIHVYYISSVHSISIQSFVTHRVYLRTCTCST